MKKLPLYLIALSGLAFASCTEDEAVYTPKDVAINFRSAVGTRAVETTNANLEDINVAAFLGSQEFFAPMNFHKGSDSFFTSATEYYWPGDNSELSFYAYAPANPGGTLTIDNDTKTLTDFSPAAEIADQIDFITSQATGKKSLNEAAGVPLTFDHKLSQIEIQAKADMPGYSFKVTGIRIGQPISKGSFNFTPASGENEWTLADKTVEGNSAIYTTTYTTPVTLTAEPQNLMATSGNAMLIPQQLVAWDHENDAANANKGSYISLKLQINTEAGAQVYPFPSNGDCQWAAIPIDTNWEPGKKYVYTLDLSHGAGYVDPNDPIPGNPVFGGPIKFTVDVTEWTDSPVDLPMNTGSDNN